MATKTFIQTIDDLTGEPDATARTFGLDGVSYRIDLTDANYERLTAFLQPYIDKATRLADGRAPRSSSSVAPVPRSKGIELPTSQKAAFRDWAIANGRWTGKRPKNADIDEFLRSRRPE